ncbi:MAG: hypothetical protein HRT57_02415, partial [Crocinitomicaceae bacterium]|nr:hypothetical protein [Crocinitomicaceae bacterium]
FNEMITPVKNNYGFGLFIEKRDDGLYIGHSGKNYGFTNEALFNLKTQNGIVVLTDSDRGFGLIREIQRTVPGKDKWVRDEQIVIQFIEIAEEDQEKYLGNYRFKGRNGEIHKVRVFFKKGVLIGRDLDNKRDNILIPEGEGKYRESTRGTPVVFEFKDGKTIMHWGEYAHFIKG